MNTFENLFKLLLKVALPTLSLLIVLLFHLDWAVVFDHYEFELWFWTFWVHYIVISCSRLMILWVFHFFIITRTKFMVLIQRIRYRALVLSLAQRTASCVRYACFRELLNWILNFLWPDHFGKSWMENHIGSQTFGGFFK